MNVQSFPFTFKHEGKTYKVKCSSFTPSKEKLYRIHIPNENPKSEFVIVFHERKTKDEKLFYYKLHDPVKDGIALSAKKALEKML